MANRRLEGKTIGIPEEVLTFLEVLKTQGVSQGGQRIATLLNKPECSYYQLKRIKHDIENKYQDTDTWAVLYRWVSQTLQSWREGSDADKEALSDAGKYDAYRKEDRLAAINDLKGVDSADLQRNFNEGVKKMKKLISYGQERTTR